VLKLITALKQQKKQYELVRFYKQFVKNGDLCFDIGANIGERTQGFLKAGAKVLAVEPQANCIKLLAEKFSGNKNVVILKAALGATEGVAELMLCDETTECSTLSADFQNQFSGNLNWTKKEIVDLTTLDDFCSQYGVPRFCKIDVEGYESEVLSGLSCKINYICFEFNMPLIGDTLLCLSKIEKLGNYECNFLYYEKMKLVLHEWIPVAGFKKSIHSFLNADVKTGEIIVRLC
jgi:FkbM family methyltransferase